MNVFRTTLLTLIVALYGLMGRPVYGDDLADLQGKWELVLMQNGVEHRVIKTIEDQSETVEVFSNGQLTQKHVVDFTIEIAGSVKIFKWKNGRIIAGPYQGKNLPDGRFIFRLKDKKWIAVHGMLEGDRTDLMIERYVRPEPKLPSAKT